MSRKTKAVINLEHIKSNYLAANRWAPQSKNIAVIKADAYGHGLVEVAKSLQDTVSGFAVAIIDEAIKLRDEGINGPILILQGINDPNELELAVKYNLQVVIHNLNQLDIIVDANLLEPISVWLKLDTGMHRLGLNKNDFSNALKIISNHPHINDAIVVSSHFSCSDELDNNETGKQIDRFNEMISDIKNLENFSFSLANSAALAGCSEARLDWNRPGIMLYGLPLFDRPHKTDNELKPAMCFQSVVIGLRTIAKGETVGYGMNWIADKISKIATISVGYADGYPRHARNGTPVLINGERTKLVGTVSMDLISVDVTEINEVEIGDPVELWGENLSANEVAKCAGTIGYDLITGVSKRVPRKYI